MNKPNYVAEAPYQPGYEDAIITESKPVLYGIYKSKPLTDQERLTTYRRGFLITLIRTQADGSLPAR